MTIRKGNVGLDRTRPDLVYGGRAQVAQLVEHATENRGVGGSIPPLGTTTCSSMFLCNRIKPVIHWAVLPSDGLRVPFHFCLFPHDTWEESMTRLTVARVNSLTKPGRYGDGATLYLFIAPGGTKSWVQRITIAGRRADIGLGAYPAISLAKARQLVAASRTLIAEGGDPLEVKRKAAVPTFREAAEETFETNKTRWRNAKAATNWMQQLEKHAFPILGGMRIDRVDREHLLRDLAPIWTT